jgi:hypothetical protein
MGLANSTSVGITAYWYLAYVGVQPIMSSLKAYLYERPNKRSSGIRDSDKRNSGMRNSEIEAER